MPSNQTFFEQVKARFHESQKQRSDFATRLYNYGSPSAPMRKSTAYWFEPYNRAKFRPFESYLEFTDDLLSAVTKPIVFLILGAVETLKRILCIPAALVQVFKLSPTGFFHKVFDFCETIVFGELCEFWVIMEVFLQLGSLAMRLGLTALSAIGVDFGPEERNDLSVDDFDGSEGNEGDEALHSGATL